MGIRIAIMIAVLLPPTDAIFQFFSHPPFTFSKIPTVDRTMQGLRIRATVILVMTIAELYAAVLRIVLWIQGALLAIQQDMAIKNIMFLSSVYSAYSYRVNTLMRDWNSRDLGFGLKIPLRRKQLT